MSIIRCPFKYCKYIGTIKTVKIHMSLMHDIDDIIICPICNTEYKKRAISAHILRKHSEKNEAIAFRDFIVSAHWRSRNRHAVQSIIIDRYKLVSGLLQ